MIVQGERQSSGLGVSAPAEKLAEFSFDAALRSGLEFAYKIAQLAASNASPRGEIEDNIDSVRSADGGSSVAERSAPVEPLASGRLDLISSDASQLGNHVGDVETGSLGQVDGGGYGSIPALHIGGREFIPCDLCRGQAQSLLDLFTDGDGDDVG